MRRLGLRLILCLLIVLAVPGALIGFAFGLPAQYDCTYLSALSDKLNRLETADGQRIILIGGSGAAFDVRCDLLEQELPGYQAVNFGLYAGLGTAVMLDLAEPYLRPGDIVVFLPEQNEQTLSAYFSAASLWQALDGQAIPWAALTADQRSAMIGAFPAYAAGKARLYFFDGKPLGDAVYARRSFNGWGDMACAGRDQNVMPGGFDANIPISFDLSLLDDGLIGRVNAFAAACAEKGAALYYAFCPMNEDAIPEAERALADGFAQALARRLACPLLGTPEDAILDAGWFFDTNFHLNEAGQAAYTARLARLLKDALGDETPVAIAIPDMPAQSAPVLKQGDDSDADCFQYEARDGGVWIVGLTGAGEQREEMTVPTVFDQQPVLGFDAAVFAGSEKLRTLVLQENIAAIPDGAFAGCAALERIVLRNARPETVSVGPGLLDGTSARVIVPAASFSAYATSYFWSPHAARLAGEDGLLPGVSPAPQTKDGQ